MKYFIFSLSFALAFWTSSCDEIPPSVNPSEGERNVLIEEFTGVRCVQCPAGSVEIADLLDQHQGRLVAVSIHAGEFAPPFPESPEDFRTAEGEELINFLGTPISYPSAVIDRMLFPGQNDLILGRNDWAGYIATERAIPARILIELRTGFDETSRKLDLEVKLVPLENFAETDVRISIMLTESNIVGVQDTPEGKVADYVHNHVLRGMLTSFLGESIPEPLTEGAIVTKNYSFTVPGTWKEADMEAIAFVHLGGTTKEVLQVVSAHVIE